MENRKIKNVKKIAKNILKVMVLAFIIWILIPYGQVWVLSEKYGQYFEEGYKQCVYFTDDPYSKPRVFRYKNEKARIASDTQFVTMAMEDESENIAVVCYGWKYVLEFHYDGKEWVMDNFIILESATTSNTTWPFYLW